MSDEVLLLSLISTATDRARAIDGSEVGTEAAQNRVI